MLLARRQLVILQKPLQKLLYFWETVVHAILSRLRLQDGRLQESHSLQMTSSWDLKGMKKAKLNTMHYK